MQITGENEIYLALGMSRYFGYIDTCNKCAKLVFLQCLYAKTYHLDSCLRGFFRGRGGIFFHLNEVEILEKFLYKNKLSCFMV